jgi:hypothetical protein
MIKLLGISARKQGGKNTSANIVAGTILHSVGYVTSVDPNTGDLLFLDDTGKNIKLDIASRNPMVKVWLEENIHPFVKLYDFADSLKEFCINMFGLLEEQVYGTDEQKNIKTKFKWNIFRKFLNKDTYEEVNKNNCWNKYMTGREFMQVMGTDIMRSIYNDCWVNDTLNKIDKEKVRYAIVRDIRFPNEVEGIEQKGGIVIRLLRSPFKNEDLHSSELALDNYTFKHILDNSAMTISQQSAALAETLKNIGW